MSCLNCQLKSAHSTLRECIAALRAANDDLSHAWRIEHTDSEAIERELDKLRPLARAARDLYREVRFYSFRNAELLRTALVAAEYLKPEEAK